MANDSVPCIIVKIKDSYITEVAIAPPYKSIKIAVRKNELNFAF